MPDRSSAALPVAFAGLRALTWLNWLFGAAILALLLGTLVDERWMIDALGIAQSSDPRSMMIGMRGIALLGLGVAFCNYVILKLLIAIVDTVRIGDPFVTANSRRLGHIAWSLLALQLLSLAVAGIAKVISTAEHPLVLDAGFSPIGWMAVVLIFVLSRVFAEGTSMREELEGTV